MPHPLYLITRYIKSTGENAPKLQKILDDHAGTLAIAKGSLYKHQDWEGGYLQHVADCLTIARRMMNDPWPMPFTWSSVVSVLFLHDIEKPFMQLQLAIGDMGDYKPWSKKERMQFRMNMISKYDITLTKEELLALTYIEGEGADYSPYKRVMNELGALCHAADVLSARLWHSRNKPEIK